MKYKTHFESLQKTPKEKLYNYETETGWYTPAMYYWFSIFFLQ